MNSNMQKILTLGKISCICLIFALITIAASPAASSEPYVSDQAGDQQTDVQDMEVRVNPDRDINCVKTMEKGGMTIAVLGSDELDVKKIQEDSVAVSSVKTSGEVKPYTMEYVDINSDGYEDIVMGFSCQELINQLGLTKCFCKEAPLKVRATIEENEGIKTIEGNDATLILPRFR